ncbi:MAG: LacI family DNA-binding transcriptional regulator [Microbacterium sp.]
MSEKSSPPGRRPTLRMVAERAGVSTATVSYVFSGRAGAPSGRGVAEATAARVLQAAGELHYRPNRAARAIRTGRTGTVQLALHMLSDPWSLAVADAVNEEANRHGLTTLILADGDWYTSLNRLECDVVYLDGVDAGPQTRAKLQGLVDRGQRMVVFSDALEPSGFDVVRSNPLPGAAIAMDHLLQRHTRIGALVAETAVEASALERTRYTVYTERMAAAGLDIAPGWTSTFGTTQASAYHAAVRLLQQDDRPSAIYATTDFAGIAAINAAHMLGLRVPQDVAVIGLGSTPDAQTVRPSLTTVGPIDFYAQQARIIVDRAVEGHLSPARLHEFAWSLVPGDSTRLEQGV